MKILSLRNTIIPLLLLALLLLGAMPKAAMAGSNGQQLWVQTPCSVMDWGAKRTVTVSGTNQRGEFTEWKGSTTKCDIGTYNAWWVGSTTVTVQYAGFWKNWTKTVTTNVPKSQWGNWHYVSVKP